MNALRHIRSLIAGNKAGQVDSPGSATATAADPVTVAPDRESAIANEAAAARQKFEEANRLFKERARELGHEEATRLFWYHTVELGSGLVTPGVYDYRNDVEQFGFPQDMRGLNVLEIGSATGFWAFELERRGADVVSVELPSIGQWDLLPRDRERTLQRLMTEYQVRTVEELHHVILEGPFQFCRRVLGSRVRRCYAPIYDLSPQVVGAERFDLVLLGDILVHLLSPLEALAAAAELCSGTLVLALDLLDASRAQPIMYYLGGSEWRAENDLQYWVFNLLCIEHMLKRVGFNTVNVVGHYSGIAGNFGRYNRTVLHASKSARV